MSQDVENEIELNVICRLSRQAYEALLAESKLVGFSLDDIVTALVQNRFDPEALNRTCAAFSKRLDTLGVTEEEFFSDIDEGIAEARDERSKREEAKRQLVTRDERETGREDE